MNFHISQKNNEMQLSLNKLIPRLSSQIIGLPYILVEYKPAFGHIFADYLTEYSHWGYSDFDVVFGDTTCHDGLMRMNGMIMTLSLMGLGIRTSCICRDSLRYTGMIQITLINMEALQVFE